MIGVKVTAVLEIAELLGKRKQVILMPEGSRVEDLVNLLVAKHGQRLRDRFFQSNSQMLRKDVYLFLNGRHIFFFDGVKTVLKEGDEVLIMPAAGGG